MKKNIGIMSIRFAMFDNKLARCVLCGVPKSIYCERILWESVANAYFEDGEKESVFSFEEIFRDEARHVGCSEDAVDICRALAKCWLEERKLVKGVIRALSIIPCFSKLSVDKDTKTIRVKMNREILPYISVLQEQFVKIPMEVFSSLNSIYAQGLYRLMRSHIKRGTACYKLITLADFLCVPDYARTGENFSKHILKPAIKEINKETDINIYFTPVKDGKHITAYNFGIVDVYNIDRRQKEYKELQRKHIEHNKKMKNNPDPDPVPAIYDFDTIGL